ncbi:MAG: PHP domain-containing protein [Lentisphaerae bacterium]|nr:PHP domain-containing protein [Lentisphaerota bacterium]MBR2871971.1 PHP domain-containing protein [Lentisphaeria bacterium]
MFYYDLYPKMVPADEVSVIRIRPRFAHAEFKGTLKILHSPYDRTRWQYEPEWSLEDGVLIVKAHFESEQEHCIQVVETLENGKERKFDFRVFSLYPDLYALRPFKGDIHLHSIGSDGSEDGRYVAARYREAGFDFMALTDHRLYEPSLEVMAYWKEVNPDFKLFPGEEVHSPENPVHIVNFGGKGSVNAIYRADEEKYRKEVAEIIETFPDKEPDRNYFVPAAAEWVFKRIQEKEGLAVFCHPYWNVPAGNYVAEWINDFILERRKFDAYEIIGGFDSWQYHSNNLQVVRYYEEMSKGNHFPVVGVSDSHGTDAFPFDANRAGRNTNDSSDAALFDWYYTIVFAENCELSSLIGNIKKFNSLGVCAPAGERAELFGSFRHVRYGHFLLREYFPQLRSLCAVEGQLMQQYLAGEKETLTALKALMGKTSAYRERCFQRCKE